MSYELTKTLLKAGDTIPLKPSERLALLTYCFRASDEGECSLGYGRIAKQLARDKANLRKDCLELQKKKLLSQRDQRGFFVNLDQILALANKGRAEKAAAQKKKKRWAKRKQQDPFSTPNALQMVNEEDDIFLRNILQNFISKRLTFYWIIVLLGDWRFLCSICKYKPEEILKELTPALTDPNTQSNKAKKVANVSRAMGKMIKTAISMGICTKEQFLRCTIQYDFESFYLSYPHKIVSYMSFIDEWYKWIDQGKTPEQLLNALHLAEKTPDGLRLNSNIRIQTPESWLRNSAKEYLNPPKPVEEEPSKVLQAWEAGINR